MSAQATSPHRGVSMFTSHRERAPHAERAASRGICEQYWGPFRGRQDKRFCSDRCRTRFGRERKVRELQDLTARLLKLGGVGQ
jgi:hypothetical protein